MNFQQELIYKDALKWIDKHGSNWDVKLETEEDKNHIAALLTDFAYHRWEIEKRSAALRRGDSGLNQRGI